jgi:hypothetical protein
VVRKRVAFVGLGALCALAFAGSAAARGGRYVFEGGTAKEHAQVRVALEVSMFNWGLVPATVTIHLHRVVDSYATRGEIWLDTRLVDAGTFSWGTIQHEYAHQVDFFLLNDPRRAELNRLLGGTVWSHTPGTVALHGADHASLGAERFASTLAWSYWPSPANSLRPSSKKAESAAMVPAKFRALLQRMLGVPNPVVPVVTVG